jgi:bacteriocin-type transport-associated protein
MTDTLLRVLSNADLDWIITHGERQMLSTGESLLYPHIAPDRLSLVVEGCLGASFTFQARDPQNRDSQDRAAEAAIAIEELGRGELVGFSPLLETVHTTAVKALMPTQVVALPIAQIRARLADDVAFAAHLYHGIALLLADRLRRIFEHPDRVRGWGDRPSNDVLTVFSQLWDSDIDWLTSFGQTQTIASDRVLLQAARPVEFLYIVLDGQMTLSAPQDTFNPFALCFLGLERATHNPMALATLTQGSMPGIISFLDFRPLPVTVRSLSECLVFAVPRQALATKLQVDDSFASRFYRVIAMQILEQLQTVSLRLVDPAIAVLSSDDEELDMDNLQQLSEGAKKFGWMLSQLGVSHDG